MVKISKTRVALLSGLVVVLTTLLAACTDAPAGFVPMAANGQSGDGLGAKTMTQGNLDSGLLLFNTIEGITQAVAKGENSWLGHKNTIVISSVCDTATGRASTHCQPNPLSRNYFNPKEFTIDKPFTWIAAY
jgi:hypothetical protein